MGRYEDEHLHPPTFVPFTGTPPPSQAPQIGTPELCVPRVAPSADGFGVSPAPDRRYADAFAEEHARFLARKALLDAGMIEETPTHFLFVDDNDRFHCCPVVYTLVTTIDDPKDETKSRTQVVTQVGKQLIGGIVKLGTTIRAIGPREVAKLYNTAG